MGQRGLAHPGYVLDQQMSAGNQSNDAQPNGLGLTLDYRLDCLLQTLDLLGRIGTNEFLFSFYRIQASHPQSPGGPQFPAILHAKTLAGTLRLPRRAVVIL